MSWDKMASPAQLRTVARWGALRQSPVLFVLVATVIVVDQATKWLGWRHGGAIINRGGNWLVGRTIGGWYKDPLMGPLLDLLSLLLVSVALSFLVRGRRPAIVLASGALMLGGWGSNLLDRLGVHHWTAPGSGRGAVDFVHIGRYFYNFADFCIIGATTLFLLSIASVGWRAKAPAAGRPRPAAEPVRLASR
jgi:lipoprotein signal peptidase